MKQFSKIFRILLCLMLSVVLVLSMSSIAMADEAKNEEVVLEGTNTIVNGDEVVTFEPVAQNQGMALYADMSNGYFYLENLVSGKKWYSVPIDSDIDPYTAGKNYTNLRSQVVIEYISASEVAWSSPQFANSYSDASFEVKKVSNGICVTYVFSALGISFDVEYTLQNGYLDAKLRLDSIKEDEFKVISVNVLPSFGAGNWEAEGYLFVPDGSGALVTFNNKIITTTNYKAMVYGTEATTVEETKKTNTESIRLPVFGTVTENNALMGVITQGDAVSYITAVNGHDRCGYNAVSSIFQYRFVQSQLNMFNKKNVNMLASPAVGLDAYTVRYYVLDGDKANYTGMASAYRDYLIKEKGFTKKTITPKFHVRTLGFYEEKASFLGVIPYTKKVALTTYSEAMEIAKDLTESGIDALSLQYFGWSNSGITNKKIPNAATPVGTLGGKKAFASLVDYCKQQQCVLVPEVDLLTFQKNGNGVRANKDAARTVFGKVVRRSEYILSNYVYKLQSDVTALVSPTKMDKVFTTYLESLKKQGITHVNLGNFGDYCYANYYLKDEQNRSLFPQKAEEILKKYNDAGIAVSVSGGNAYTLPYVSRVTDVPVCSSGYDMFDIDVPFYQILLHGYVSYTTKPIVQTADPKVTYLAAVENGSELLYNGMHEEASELFDTDYTRFYGSTWRLWKDTAAEQHKAYYPLQAKVADQEIIAHTEVAEKVYLTKYANGVCVAVNYNKTDVVLENGKTVGALNFIEWRENA
ncbi:MAG: hypothetical protein J6Q42_00390 [Clostridia bacterium]|nr:hypothetical protein [Clostridia bacterium]